MIPPLPPADGGVALVIGSAVGVENDVAAAERAYPGAVRIAVNYAARDWKADHLFSLHGEREMWAQFRAWNPDALTHMRGNATTKAEHPWIDHVWPELGRSCSGWEAAKMALLMGHDLAVLCGSPLDPLPYNDDRKPVWQTGAYYLDFRSAVERDTWAHPKVVSMSGWSKTFLETAKG